MKQTRTKTGRRPKLTNVREHLKHIERFIDGFRKYGDCPIIRQDLAEISVINQAILNQHEVTRKAGNRKDIRVEHEQHP